MDIKGLIASLEEILELITVGRVYMAREKLKALVVALKVTLGNKVPPG